MASPTSRSTSRRTGDNGQVTRIYGLIGSITGEAMPTGGSPEALSADEEFKHNSPARGKGSVKSHNLLKNQRQHARVRWYYH
ncbi:unnamed protein product [Rhizoctonia solani]|nr:unnamed protein product [Rhizoctonia solani]